MIKVLQMINQFIEVTASRAANSTFSLAGAKHLVIASSVFFSVALIGLSSGFVELIKFEIELVKDAQIIAEVNFESIAAVDCSTVDQVLISACNGLKHRANTLDSAVRLAKLLVMSALCLGVITAIAASVAFLRGSYVSKVRSK